MIQSGVSLKRLNTWHIGGKATHYAQPSSVDELKQILSDFSQDKPIHWLGLGSNVLIPDEGLSGLVIHTKKLQAPIQGLESVRVTAGVTCAKLARYCVQAGLAGATFFAGIPGTVGGALAMNAGAFGGETWQSVLAVEVINRAGQTFMLKPSDFEIAYRLVKPKGEAVAFLAAHFVFPKGDPALLQQELRALIQKRNQSQPIGTYSCGSVFTNPPGDYAARLIDACGLKGFRIGDIMVSEKHANFMINVGEATANDTLALMQAVQKRVHEATGILLQSEVRILY